MKRSSRSVLGAIGGALWGVGIAVLIQQYGLWPLDPALAYGAPLAGTIISGLWGSQGSGRRRRLPAGAALAVIPAVVLGFQQPTCEVELATNSNAGLLAATSPTSPFEIDPAQDDQIAVFVFGGKALDGAPGQVWIEFGGFRTFTQHGVVSGVLRETFDLTDNGYADLSGAPGIYRVGGSIEDVCDAGGYIRIKGNPLTAPVGQAALGAVAIGLLMTWFAGRPGEAPVPVATRGRLLPAGEPLQLAEATVRSPGLAGYATVHAPSETALRSVARWTNDTRTALDHHHLEPERIIEVSHTAEVADQGAAPIATHHGDPAFRIELPTPGPDHGQLLLASDEGGAISWHLPRLADGTIDIQRLNASCIYRIRRRVPPGDEQERNRGVLTAIGAKVLTSLIYPLLDPVFGEVGDRYARSWESRRRPYRFRSFTPDGYYLERATEPDWDLLAGGTSLLFIHGTFSRAHTGFGNLPDTAVEDLHELYNGRVFAFDHHTLSDDPRHNVEWFLTHIPQGIRLNLDIVCHSRGGLVSRVLAEKQDEMGAVGIEVGKIVFVGSPNAGTILAEPAYVGDLIDSYTNLLNFVPGPPIADVLEGVITAIKQIAVGAVAGMPGLQAMRPGGEFLRWLNVPASNQGRYFAVAGDYEPQIPAWRDRSANVLMDRIFREANDLVVPTTGTYAANGSPHFPVERRLVFGREDGVDHTGYFGNKRVRDRLLEWLADGA